SGNTPAVLKNVFSLPPFRAVPRFTGRLKANKTRIAGFCQSALQWFVLRITEFYSKAVCLLTPVVQHESLTLLQIRLLDSTRACPENRNAWGDNPSGSREFGLAGKTKSEKSNVRLDGAIGKARPAGTWSDLFSSARHPGPADLLGASAFRACRDACCATPHPDGHQMVSICRLYPDDAFRPRGTWGARVGVQERWVEGPGQATWVSSGFDRTGRGCIRGVPDSPKPCPAQPRWRRRRDYARKCRASGRLHFWHQSRQHY